VTEPGLRDANYAVAAGIVQLRTQVRGGRFREAGTGFFFRNGSQTFLITCLHVLEPKNELPSERVSFRAKTGQEYPSPCREVELSLRETSGPSFRRFKEPPIDLAAIPLTEKVLEGCWTFSFGPEHLPPDDIYLPIGSEVILPGYPMGHYDEQNNLPIVRRGSVGSLYPVPFNGRPYFQIDANLQAGMSGAPVLLRPDSFVYRYSQPFKFMGGPVSYLLGVHSEGFDELGIHIAWYARLLLDLTQ